MRNVLFVLTVLFLVTRGYAGLIFTPETNEDGTATVSWTSDQGVVGMSLKLSIITGGEGLTCEFSGFNVIVDPTHEIPGGFSDPIANPSGIFDCGDGCVISVGYLSPEHEGLLSGTIHFDADEYTTLAIEDDDLRGGAVGIGGEALSFTPFEVTVLPEPLTMALMGAGGVIIARKRRA